MKPLIPLFLRSLIATVLLAAVTCVSSATTVVFSNLVPENAGNAARLTDSHGTPLAVGCWIQLGYFGTLSPAEITALAQQGNQALLSAFTPSGNSSSIGTGADSLAGRVEFAAHAPLSQSRSGLHAVVFNAATTSAATEVLVVALPGTVPADDNSGLIGFLSVHLENASLVVGTASDGALSTKQVASGFDAWMAEQDLTGLTTEQLLPGADADLDGIPNLVEYALGSLAGDASSRAATDFARGNGMIRLRFLVRNDDANLVFVVETSNQLTSGDWTVSPQPLLAMPSPPSPAPTGYEWHEIEIPVSDTRHFARVRVTLNP